MSDLVIPKKARGRSTAEKEEQYLEEMAAFASRLQQIQSTIDFRMSSRGWAYYLEQVEGVIDKSEFDKAQKVVNDCRKGGFLSFDFCLEDKTREVLGVQQIDSEDPRKFLATQVSGVCELWEPVAFWATQDVYLELAVEKIDLLSLFEPVLDAFLMARVNFKGWSDINSRCRMLNRFKKWAMKGKLCVLLYCGDHDPAGINISNSIRKNFDDVASAIGVDWPDATDYIEVDRIGLNYDFIEAHGLTWIDNLMTGGNRDLARPQMKNRRDIRPQHVLDYIEQFGARKVEANALVADAVAARKLIRDSILQYVDEEAGDAYTQRLEEEREALREIAKPLIDELEE